MHKINTGISNEIAIALPPAVQGRSFNIKKINDINIKLIGASGYKIINNKDGSISVIPNLISKLKRWING